MTPSPGPEAKESPAALPQLENAAALEPLESATGTLQGRAALAAAAGLPGLRPAHVIALQQTAGNVAVTRMLHERRLALARAPVAETEEAAPAIGVAGPTSDNVDPEVEGEVTTNEAPTVGAEGEAEDEALPPRVEPEDAGGGEPEAKKLRQPRAAVPGADGPGPIAGEPPQTGETEDMRQAVEADAPGGDADAAPAPAAETTAKDGDDGAGEDVADEGMEDVADEGMEDVDDAAADFEADTEADSAEAEAGGPDEEGSGGGRLMRLKATTARSGKAADDGILATGDKGRAVKALQRDLRALGWYKGAVDGIFGQVTHRAVTGFQKAAGLQADGKVGPQTRKTLASAVALRRLLTRFINWLKTIAEALRDWLLGKIRALRRRVSRFLAQPGGGGGGSRPHQGGSGAAPGGPTAAPPAGGTKVGIVAESGEERAKLRQKPNRNAPIVAELPFNTRLFIDRKVNGWYFVTLGSGRYGYVSELLVKTNLPEPTAKLDKIGSGESAIGLAERHYKSLVRPGQDLRFYVNVLEYVNRGPGARGVYQPNPSDNSRGAWKNVKTRANYLIWVPSDQFARSLKGEVSSGSLTGGAWARTRKVVEAVGDFAIGGAAFVAGLLDGAVSAVWDLLVGLKGLATGLWGVLRSLFEGNILRDAKNLWTAVTRLKPKEIAEGWINRFVARWTHPDVWARWKFRGWVAGYAIAEIAMIVLTGGGSLAVKLAAKAGKVGSKLMGAVKGFSGKVAGATAKAPKAAVSALKMRLYARQLVELGLSKPYVNRLNEAQREAVKKALDRWNIARGKSQGVTHIVDYAEGGGGAQKTGRLERLEEYNGVGPFDVKDPGVIPQVTDALDSLITRDGVRRGSGNGSTVYWIPRADTPAEVLTNPPKGAKGTIVMKYQGKYTTFHHGEFRRYLKLTAE